MQAMVQYFMLHGQMTSDGGVPIVFSEALKSSMPESVYKAMGALSAATCHHNASINELSDISSSSEGFSTRQDPLLSRSDKSIRYVMLYQYMNKIMGDTLHPNFLPLNILYISMTECLYIYPHFKVYCTI